MSHNHWPLSQRLTALTLIALLAGLSFRLGQYLSNPGMHPDEAMLVANILSRDIDQLLKPLEYVQMAPAGFLILQKWLTNLFGTQELVLRFLPLVCSLMSLTLFYRLASREFNKLVALTAICLFSTDYWLIFYTAFIKQYASDVLCSVVILYVTASITRNPSSHRLSLLTLIGVLAITLSQSAILVLGASNVVLLIRAIHSRNLRTGLRLCLTGVIWLTISVILIKASDSTDSPVYTSMKSYWQGAFPPPQASVIESLSWLLSAVLLMMKNPLGLFRIDVIGAALLLPGYIYLFQRRATWFWLTFLPLLFTLAVSFAGVYPFQGRLLAHLVPSLMLVMACGTYFIAVSCGRFRSVIAAILLVLLLAPGLVNGALRLSGVKTYAMNEFPSTLHYLKEHQKDSDAVYVYYIAKPAFDYYAKQFEIDLETVIPGANLHEHIQYPIAAGNYETRIRNEFERIRKYDRIWLIFLHVSFANRTDELKKMHVNDENSLLKKLEQEYDSQDSFHALESSVYLYRRRSP